MQYAPSTPDPETTTLVYALLRHVLTILATVGVLHGTYSDSTVQIVAGAMAGIGAIFWSIYQKWQAARLDHEGSVRSVAINAPVRAS